MYCRHCANQVSEKAVGCPKCGMNPRVGAEFCHDCGSETKSNQVMCTNCGVALNGKSSLPKAQASSSSGSSMAQGDYERVYCSSDEKMLFGLCGGLSHKTGIDVSVVRGGVFIITLLTWFPLLVYIGLGIILPKLPTRDVLIG